MTAFLSGEESTGSWRKRRRRMMMMRIPFSIYLIGILTFTSTFQEMKKMKSLLKYLGELLIRINGSQD